MHYLIIFMALALSACGPSSGQLKTAKTAKYKATPAQIFDIALAVTGETYKIAQADGQAFRIQTHPQFYTAEGGRVSVGAEGWTQAGGGDVRLEMVVEVIDMGEGNVSVVVTPTTFQLLSGSPKPRELKPDDPYLPPWILGRRDSLSLAIYERAKGYVAAP